MAKTRVFAAWLVLALVVGASVAPLLAQALPWVVNHDTKQCMPNPGIGLGGWAPAAACPEGYAVVVPKPPEKSWWEKLAESLNTVFGLSDKVAFVFEVSKLATVAAFVAFLKRALAVFGITVSGKANWILSAVTAFIAYIEPMVADGKMTYYEVLLAVLWFVFGSGIVWKALKSVVLKLSFFKELAGAFTGR